MESASAGRMMVLRKRPPLGPLAGTVSCCAGNAYCGLWPQTRSLQFLNPQHYCPACRGYLHGALCGVKQQVDDSDVASSLWCYPCFDKVRQENPAVLPLFFSAETLQWFEGTRASWVQESITPLPPPAGPTQMDPCWAPEEPLSVRREEEEPTRKPPATPRPLPCAPSAPPAPERTAAAAWSGAAHSTTAALSASEEGDDDGSLSSMAGGDPAHTEAEQPSVGEKETSDRQIKRRKSRPMSFWYQLCHTYMTKGKEQGLSPAQFLLSDMSGPEVIGTKSEHISFSNRLKLYRAGQLKPHNSGRRCRKAKYPLIADRLAQYVKVWSEQFKMDKGDLTWKLLRKKCLQWRDEIKDPIYRDFRASNGFISDVMRRYGLNVKIKDDAFGLSGSFPGLHGSEGGENTMEDVSLSIPHDPPVVANVAVPQASPARVPVPPPPPRVDEEKPADDEPIITYHTVLSHIMDLRQYALSIGVSAADMSHFEKFQKVIWRLQPKGKRKATPRYRSSANRKKLPPAEHTETIMANEHAV